VRLWDSVSGKGCVVAPDAMGLSCLPFEKGRAAPNINRAAHIERIHEMYTRESSDVPRCTHRPNGKDSGGSLTAAVALLRPTWLNILAMGYRCKTVTDLSQAKRRPWPWRRKPLADIDAEVAELADAPVSKSGPRKGVWVRVPPSAVASTFPWRSTKTSLEEFRARRIEKWLRVSKKHWQATA
jgi:hypothetical protein